MASVEVRDSVLWTKHIHGAPQLRAALEGLAPETTVELRVAGAVGVWRKMKANGKTNAATPGLQPLGPAATHWREMFRESKISGGAVVDIEVVDPALSSRMTSQRLPSGDWEQASPAERKAAWEAFKALWGAGWRSEAPYGSRDELYDRS